MPDAASEAYKEDTVHVSPAAMAKELTDADLRRLCPGCPIIEYSKLKETPLEGVVGPGGGGLILFVEQSSGNTITGHWLAAVHTGGDTIEFFDPYGARRGGDPWFLDHTFVPSASLRALSESTPVVSAWAQQNGVKPVFNPTRFQVMKEGINTCGRHCAVRLQNSHFDNTTYTRYIRHYCDANNCNPDELVTAWTSRYTR